MSANSDKSFLAIVFIPCKDAKAAKMITKGLLRGETSSQQYWSTINENYYSMSDRGDTLRKSSTDMPPEPTTKADWG